MQESGSEYLYVLLRRAVREIERLEAAGLGKTRAALRPGHVPVLAALLDASPLTPGELAARCEIEPSTLTGLLQTLERQGLIGRERVVRDQRTQAVTLTPRGRAAGRIAVRTRAWAQQSVLRALPKESGQLLASLLGQLTAAAQEATALAEEQPPRLTVRKSRSG